jgi:K+-sensing histidine kinase KdpD
MMSSPITKYRGAAAQCFFGIIALVLVTYVCLQLKATLGTVAFAYLAVVVLLSLFGSLFASVVLIIMAVAGLAYCFSPPVSGSAIGLPQDIAMVIVFLLTPLTVTWSRQTRPHADGSCASGRSNIQAGGKGASARH